MNRKVLKALMQLFALVSGNTETNAKSQEVIEKFLLRLISKEQLNEFMAEFHQIVSVNKHQGDSNKANKKRSASSVKILRICNALNEELTLGQKGVVFLRLVEFLSSQGNISEKDSEFADTVASSFYLSDEQQENTKTFVAGNLLIDSSRTNAFLLPENTKQASDKSIRIAGLEAQVSIFKLPEENIYFIRLEGEADFSVNGIPLKPKEIYSFPSGSIIRSSKFSPVYFSDIVSLFHKRSKKEKIVFAAKQIEFRFPNGQIGLHKFSFMEESGNLVGIMGSSGAGKSTLLNILNGNEKPSAGKVLINGQDLHSEETEKEGLLGYVSQDDLLISELSVFENLWFNALLCFSNASKIELLRKVHLVLNDLGLAEIKHLKVGDPLHKTISGGQRKRLNIAIELIREPSVLFVDEPTSGLSSRDSEHIMSLLKELTLKGKLIFVVIHQPSSDIFKMFDKLILLDTGGFPVYYGNPVESVSYIKELAEYVNSSEGECGDCGNINPEQIFDILEQEIVDEYGHKTSKRRISPKEWNIFFKRGQLPIHPENLEPRELPVADFKKPNNWGQYKIFFKRDFLSKLSNVQYMAINLLEAPLLALIMGYLLRYSQGEEYLLYNNLNLPAYLLICVVASLFFGLTVSAEEIFRDRGILKREKFLNLSRGSYLFAKVSILFILGAIQTSTFVAAGHIMLGIRDLYLSDWLILFSSACFANILGLNISASFNSAVTIYILIPILIIPQLLLSGVLVQFDQLNPQLRQHADRVPFAANLMTSRWAFEALAVNRFVNNKAEKMVFDFDKSISNANFLHNYWIPEMRSSLQRINTNASQQLLMNEITRLNKTSQFQTFVAPERILNPDSEIQIEISEHLNHIEYVAKKRENRARLKKDEIILSFKGNYSSLIKNYTNEQLNRMVLRQNQFTKIEHASSERLVRNFEPVYQIPLAQGFISGPFYAHKKYTPVGYISTLYANIIVIWIMSALLFITLYFNGLKKAMQLPKLIRIKIKHVINR